MVYEGDDVRTGTKVALKVLSLKEGKAAMPMAAIQREIEYAAAMQHENIVRLLDYFMANEQQMVIVVSRQHAEHAYPMTPLDSRLAISPAHNARAGMQGHPHARF